MYDYITAVYDYITEEVLTTYLPIVIAAILMSFALLVHLLQEYRATKTKRLTQEANENQLGGLQKRWMGKAAQSRSNSGIEVGNVSIWGWIARTAFLLGVVAIIYQILQSIGLVPVISDLFN